MTDEAGRPGGFDEGGSEDTTAPVPGFEEPSGTDQQGTIPSFEEPDPAPEAEVPSEDDPGTEIGATEAPVGRDNIREGRVDGIMGGPHQSQGQGQGG
jgi:hypothetical protein